MSLQLILKRKIVFILIGVAPFILSSTNGGFATSWTVPEWSVATEEAKTTPSENKNFEVVSSRHQRTPPTDVQGDESIQDTEEPYFDSAMKSTYTAYLGKTAALACIVHGVKNQKSVAWIRSRDLRIMAVGRYTYASDLRFEAIHTEGNNEWVLRIRSVQLRDQGNYECHITTKPIKTFNVFLKVVEPSVEILGSPDIFVNRASMINLTCVVYHAPNPPEEITWYHGNETISYTSPRGGVSVVEERGETTTSFLLLQNARPSDSGSFTCQPSGMEPSVINMHVLEEGEHPAAMQTNAGLRKTFPWRFFTLFTILNQFLIFLKVFL